MARTYVDGNTVRKVNQVPAVKPGARRVSEEERRRQAARHQATVRRNQEKALRMDLPYLVMLLIASAFTLSLCFNYIQLQTSVTSRISAIEAKEKELDNLRSENDALANNIDTATDLDEVYRIATQKLGMVYAGQDQVITYDKTESEYVRQYEDIPRY